MPKRKVSFIWERKIEVTGSIEKNQVPWHWVMNYMNTHTHEHIHQYTQFAFINSLIYCVCFYVCGNASSTGYVWRSKELFGSQFSAYILWNWRVKPMSLGLEAGTFTSWAILLSLNIFIMFSCWELNPGLTPQSCAIKHCVIDISKHSASARPVPPVMNFKCLSKWMDIFDLGSEHYASVYHLSTNKDAN